MTTTTIPTSNSPIPDRLYFRIGDVADILGVKPYVLRYWESEFPMITPDKSNSGQRVYRRADVESLLMIKHLLYTERYSIEGARRRIKELRKDGALKDFRKEVEKSIAEPRSAGLTKAVPSSAGLSQARKRQLRELLGEMTALASAPVSEFFKY